MRKLITITLAYFLLSLTSFAQKNLQPGFIVKDNGDIVRGLIDYRNWIDNPRQISFQKDQNVGKETYDLTQINFFEVTGKDQYSRAIIWKDMMPVTIGQIGNEGDVKKIRDTVFLRHLVKGSRLTLYELSDAKKHYYLQEESKEPVELPYRVFYDKADPTKIVTLNTFRDQLKSYALDNPKLISKIERAHYTEKDLAAIVLQMDNSAKQPEPASANGKPLKTTEFFAGGGPSYNNIVFGGNNYQYVNDLEASSHLSYMVKAGLDIFSKRGFQNLFLRLEIGYSPYNYKGTLEREIPFVDQQETRTYKIKMNSVTPRFFLNYTVVNTKNVNAYIGAGLGYNFTSYTENDLTIENKTMNRKETKEDFLDLEKSWLEGNAQLGILYRNLDIQISSRVLGNFANLTGLKATFYTSSLGVFYRFKR